MTIEPESKNWTWVLERPCAECGFDVTDFAPEEIGRLSRECAAPWPEMLASPLAKVRPRDDCWSALEYACHVRDVYILGLYRLQRMLDEDNPHFENWDQDETAIADDYGSQNPLVVAEALLAAGTALADRYDEVTADQWDRPGLRSDGSLFTVESFGRYFVHDPMHHVVDVQRGYAELTGSA